MSFRDKSSSSASSSKATRGGTRSANQASSSNKAHAPYTNTTPTPSTSRSLMSKRDTTSHTRRTNENEDHRNKSNRSNQCSRKQSTTTSKASKQTNIFKDSSRDDGSTSGSSQEMATTSSHNDDKSSHTLTGVEREEQETNVDEQRLIEMQETDDDETSTLLLNSQDASSSSESSSDPKTRNGPNLKSITSNDLTPNKAGCSLLSITALPDGWEQHSDKLGPYYWHVTTGVIQRHRPTDEPKEASLVLYHDDEEINQGLVMQRTSSEDDDYLESGAALTLADESAANTVPSEVINFVVYPIGCCEFDETQLVSANSTRAIQKCILRLSNSPSTEETMCWGLDQSHPILMRLYENYIQFLDIKTQALFKSQPINTIKTWAVDDDNNFAFVIEERQNQVGDNSNEADYYDSVDYALLTGPTFVCYVFSSMDDDDMSCRVAAKLNEEINKYKEQISNRISKNTRIQQMIDPDRQKPRNVAGDQTDVDDDDADENSDSIEEANETTMEVKYIGKVQVPRPVGIDVLNIAIDKCLADASKAQMNHLLVVASTSCQEDALSRDDDVVYSSLIEAKIHVSPSSVIVENKTTGEIIVECRIRYLTFMGISRRDIRWCGFIMQNTMNKTFEAHCFECYPTAGHVCEAIQASCSRMYQKIVKSQRQQADDTQSIIPKSTKIRDTLAKTLSKIRLAPIIQ